MFLYFHELEFITVVTKPFHLIRRIRNKPVYFYSDGLSAVRFWSFSSLPSPLAAVNNCQFIQCRFTKRLRLFWQSIKIPARTIPPLCCGNTAFGIRTCATASNDLAAQVTSTDGQSGLPAARKKRSALCPLLYLTYLLRKRSTHKLYRMNVQ